MFYLVFIGSNLNDIYLTYLPIKSLTDKMDFRVELISLATELITYVKNIEGNEFQELISYMKKGDFNIAELTERLLLIVNKVNKNQTEEKVMTEKHSLEEHNASNKMKMKKVTFNNEQLTERQKVVLYTSSLLLIAIVWKLYLEYSSEGFLYISIGLTLLIIDIALILTKVWRPVISKIEQKEIKKVNIRPTLTPTPQNNTTMLNKNETVFLGAGEGTVARAFLEIKRNNETERIYIDRDSFIVGRGTKVNYIESSKGVSRAHFEITKTDAGYGIKDLFSKNGTYLNSQQITSNKLYPLKNGDIIAVGNLYFTFLNS